MMKLISLLTLLVLTVLGARSCSASSPSSPFNPGNVARNGLSGVCANQQAVDDAGGDPSGGGVSIPQSVQQELGGLTGTSPSCPTTTVASGGN